MGVWGEGSRARPSPGTGPPCSGPAEPRVGGGHRAGPAARQSCRLSRLCRLALRVQQRRQPAGLGGLAPAARDGRAELPGPQAAGQHPAQVADEPGAAAEQRQGGRAREEAGAQAQEEPRGAQERGRGLAEGLGRQRRHPAGRDRGGGQRGAPLLWPRDGRRPRGSSPGGFPGGPGRGGEPSEFPGGWAAGPVGTGSGESRFRLQGQGPPAASEKELGDPELSPRGDSIQKQVGAEPSQPLPSALRPWAQPGVPAGAASGVRTDPGGRTCQGKLGFRAGEAERNGPSPAVPATVPTVTRTPRPSGTYPAASFANPVVNRIIPMSKISVCRSVRSIFNFSFSLGGWGCWQAEPAGGGSEGPTVFNLT